jgi:hypothetical protein
MTRLIILPAIFAGATILLWALLINAPGWTTNDQESMWVLPSEFTNFTVLADRFKVYRQDHLAYITTLFVCTYLYKQTFAIPGSFFLVSLHYRDIIQ